MLLNGGYAKPAKSADFFEMQSPQKVRIFLRCKARRKCGFF